MENVPAVYLALPPNRAFAVDHSLVAVTPNKLSTLYFLLITLQTGYFNSIYDSCNKDFTRNNHWLLFVAIKKTVTFHPLFIKRMHDDFCINLYLLSSAFLALHNNSISRKTNEQFSCQVIQHSMILINVNI